MKEQVAIKWVKALRSGRYKQVRNTLQDSIGYCCLGVLCKISRKKYDPQENSGYCPINIMEWSGLQSSQGSIDRNKYSSVNLVTMNDGGSDEGVQPRSFEEIADFIEKNWKKL